MTSKQVTKKRWSGGFRETFLVVFTRKADAAALRRLALLLTELYRCSAQWWPPHKGGEDAAILRAVVADLRHLRYVLEWASGGTTYSELGRAYNWLARNCASEVEEIAAAIENAMEDTRGTMERHRASLMPREEGKA